MDTLFDHLGVVVADLSRSKALYDSCLSPLGVSLLQNNSSTDGEGWLFYGTGSGEPFFVVSHGKPSFWTEVHQPSQSPVHIAFRAPSRQAVENFYNKALESGGVANDEPGERPSITHTTRRM